MAEAAALMGVPALIITGGNPGPHYGYRREGELMGYAQLKFMETGDPHWIGYAWLGKVVVRAVSAATAIPEMKATRFVVTGGSKRGAACWIAAATDDRIIGAFPTSWNAGNAKEFLELKAQRWGLDYQPRQGRRTIAPAFITTREQLERSRHPSSRKYQQYTDPFQFRDRLAGKQILYAAGTNDPLFPVMSDSVFLPHMPNTVNILLVPNSGHTAGTSRHLTAWQMWLAHCFAGRDVPHIEVRSARAGGEVQVTAVVRSQTTIRNVRLWEAADQRGAYLQVKWQSHTMKRLEDGKYQCTVRVPEDRYLGFFVEVVDVDPRTVPGVFTSRFHEARPVD